MGCHFLLQEILLTQGSNPRLLHWQADSLLTEPYVVGSLLHKGSREEALCNIKTYIKAHLLSIYHVPGSILNPPVYII